MVSFKLLLSKILSIKKTRFWGTLSTKNYVEYLRNNNVKVGNNVKFRFPKSVTIDITRPSLVEFGDNIDINHNFTIMTHDFGTYVFRNLNNDYVSSSGRVRLGSNIYIARDVTILKGVTIGDNCIIGLGSVVSKDIPSNSVAVGNPCRVICSIEEYYKKRKTAQISEALDLGVSIIENLDREPKIVDFKEEWVLFLTYEDVVKYPEVVPLVKSRINPELYKNIHKPIFNGFDDFLEAIHLRMKNKHGV